MQLHMTIAWSSGGVTITQVEGAILGENRAAHYKVMGHYGELCKNG